MRIVYAYDAPLPHTGADAEQVVNTVAAMARRGTAIDLLIPAFPESAREAAALREYFHVEGEFGLGHVPRPPRTRLLEKWGFAWRVARDARMKAADLCYTRNLPTAWCLLRAGRRVVYEHFRPWGDQIPPLQPVLRWILRHPRLVGAVFHSRHTLESYRRLGIPEARMLVAHNGWDPARMEPRLSREEARTALNLPRGTFTALYSGRINARKGLDILLAAARQAPEIEFVLVGSEGEGPVEAEARQLANVRVVPWQSFRSLAPWLYAADVLVVPPSLEPLTRHGNTVLPIKLFLYLAAARPLLAPRAPDTAELLTEGVNALLVPAGDVNATVSALRALAAEPARAERLAAGARATAADLTWDARAGHILDFLATRLTAPPDSLPSGPWSSRGWLRECAGWVLGRRPQPIGPAKPTAEPTSRRAH
jgi:glycosyltransferase involved in cell wall biosynthesis